MRVAESQRNDVEALAALPVMLPSLEGRARASIPLRQVASFSVSEGLNEISRDNGRGRIYVQANVRGRDIGSFVAEAQQLIAREVKIPPGSWIEWGGQFQNLQDAPRRLSLVVPVCLALVLLVLYFALESLLLAFTVCTAVPVALVGGVFAMAPRGLPFSVSAAWDSSACAVLLS